MAKFYKVTRLDDGRLSSFSFEWDVATSGPVRFDLMLSDGLTSLSIDTRAQRLEVRLDAEELGALRRFLSEAETQREARA